MSDDLIRPHGGRLVNLLVGTERAQVLAERATHWQSWELSKRQLCDLELLLSGAFSPLQGVPRPIRLRVGLRLHAARRRHALADPGHA